MNYSQFNIEKYLDQFFDKPGSFLEIGAWDGEHISQTIHLERKGWRGLCVDPFPVNFQNRTCKLCDMAVSKDGKSRQFIKVTTDRRHGGNVSYFSGFRDSIQTHWSLIKEHCDYIEISVQTITINELYAVYDLPTYIDFLSVDTEGSELEILSSIDFNKYSYGMIMFEHNENEQTSKDIGDILLRNSYVLRDHLRLDDIYINKVYGS